MPHPRINGPAARRRLARSGLSAAVALLPALAAAQDGATYANPLPVRSQAGEVTTCADPSVLRGGEAAPWVMVCTTDPLNAEDRDANGDLRFRLVPTFTSDDLVSWEHAGDAFDRDPATPTPEPPAWADPTAVLWAPEIDRVGDAWVLLFAVTDVVDAAGGEPGCDEDSAIGLATAASPLGPWTPADAPLVAPRRAEEGCEFFWTLDPELIEAEDGRLVLYYGSFYGGIEAREVRVAEDGTWTAPEETAVPVTIANRYEGAEVVAHDGLYYLMGSATNCCAGPQTGYAVFAGRAEDPFGPFVDRDGVSLLDAGVGGTPVLVQNGNAWVGPGHNTVLQDEAGRWWTLYHAVEEAAPYLEGEPGFTRRPVLLDPLDWVEGWPVVAGGPSEGPRPAPAVRPGAAPVPPAAAEPPAELGPLLPALSDGFEGDALDPRWTWVRPPPPGTVTLGGGTLRWATQGAELHDDANDASVLTQPAPEGDYTVELRVRTDVPPEGCCQNFVQAGLVIRGSDDDYLKLVVASLWDTRQTEFGREVSDPPEGAEPYGNTVVGPPGEDWTWLRIEVRHEAEGESYTPFTSRDGVTWTQGGTWRHDLGEGATLGLVAMSGAGFTAEFDDLAVRAIP
jgi:arabinan endo-1,5-alpha-L-arabinosidase